RTESTTYWWCLNRKKYWQSSSNYFWKRLFPCHTVSSKKAGSMAQAGEGIARYHKLLDQEKYRDLAWAEELQDQMRRQKLTESGRLLAPVLRPCFLSRRQLETLTESGRLLAPVLRPCFLSRRQLETLTRVAEHIASIIDSLEALAIESPPLLR